MILGNLLIFVLAIVACETNAWRGIVPLKSTRPDVERVLGKPMYGSEGRYAAGYRTKDGKTNILYSTGPCDKKPSNGWNVAESTVIRISVYPVREPKLNELRLNLENFTKDNDPEIRNVAYYTNKADGIGFTVDTDDGSVKSFEYFPRAASGNLRCKDEK